MYFYSLVHPEFELNYIIILVIEVRSNNMANGLKSFFPCENLGCPSQGT